MRIQEVREIAKGKAIETGKLKKLNLSDQSREFKDILIAMQHHMSTNAIRLIASDAKVL